MNLLFEVKTLNSKTPDFRVYIPAVFRDMEAELRSKIQRICIRGKVDFSISLEGNSLSEQHRIHEPSFEGYLKQLQFLADKYNVPLQDPISQVLRLPNITSSEGVEISEDTRTAVLDHAEKCLESMTAFRQKEGEAMRGFLLDRIQAISDYLVEAKEKDPERQALIRERLENQMQSLQSKVEVDAVRFEQEMLYYMEKMDFSEESQRLAQHLVFFRETLSSPALVKGRKLSFVSQEIGREINTMGSKAYNADIQRLVVNMKDELEKIKEQLANIL